jgi:type VI secretion system protein ImpA
MATPPTLDFDALLAPIPGDDPSGEPLPYEEYRKKLDEYREEFDPEELDEVDPRRGDPNFPKKVPSWKAIVDLAQKALTGTSKDLLVAARLAEALTQTDGFAGARDGLCLLRRLAEECWDRLRPPVEEPDDLEVRAGIFNWLDDPAKGAMYPSKLRALPLIVHGDTPVSYLSTQGQKNRPAAVPLQALQAAARAADADRCRDVAEDIAEALGELGRLGEALNARMPVEAPSFHELRKALDDCQQVAKEILRARGTGGEAPATAGADGAPAAAAAAAARQVQTRDDAYEQLRQVAAMLEKMEPHSPVPYLIRRAVELRTMRFPELVEELTRDGNVLAFLKRESGSAASGSNLPE